MIAQVVELGPPVEETWIEFPSPSFGALQFLPLTIAGIWRVNQQMSLYLGLGLSLSLCLSPSSLSASQINNQKNFKYLRH